MWSDFAICDWLNQEVSIPLSIEHYAIVGTISNTIAYGMYYVVQAYHIVT